MSQPSRDRVRPATEKRQRILDSAVKVFAEKGYHDTRISEIARDAEIAYGLVYHYFKNKEEILDTIFFERWGEFIETVERIAERPGPLEPRLLAIAETILAAYVERSDWVKVLIFEIQRSQRFSDPARLKVVGRLFELIAGMLRDAQEAGELRREIHPELACAIFVGGLDIVVTSQVFELVSPEEVDAGDAVRIAGTVVDLFLNGMKRSEA